MILDETEGNKLIRDALFTPEPMMIARMGKVELGLVLAWHGRQEWAGYQAFEASNNAGIFPLYSKLALTEFCEVYTHSLSLADILAVWLNGQEDIIIDHYRPSVAFVRRNATQLPPH